MASADLSSPRGRTQYPYALLKPWHQGGPPPVSIAHMHANIGRRAARRANTPPNTQSRLAVWHVAGEAGYMVNLAPRVNRSSSGGSLYSPTP